MGFSSTLSLFTIHPSPLFTYIPPPPPALPGHPDCRQFGSATSFVMVCLRLQSALAKTLQGRHTLVTETVSCHTPSHKTERSFAAKSYPRKFILPNHNGFEINKQRRITLPRRSEMTTTTTTTTTTAMMLRKRGQR